MPGALNPLAKAFKPGALNPLAIPFGPIPQSSTELPINSVNSSNMLGPLNPLAEPFKPVTIPSGLLDLPPELFQQVVDDIVEIPDLPDLFRLRAVYKTLAVAFDHVLLAKVPLRTYAQLEYSKRPNLYLMNNLGEILFRRLHLPDDIPQNITSYIIWVVDEVLKFLPSDLLDQNTRKEYEKRFCHALGYSENDGWYWSDFLGLDGDCEDFLYMFSSWNMVDDCLTMAAAADNVPAIHHFLAKGGEFVGIRGGRTRYSPLVAAATNASTATVASLLERVRFEIMDWYGNLDSIPMSVLDEVIDAAAFAHAYDTAVLLINFQKEHLLTEDQRLPHHQRLTRVAKSGCVQLVNYIMNDEIISQDGLAHQETLGAVVYEACISGQAQVMEHLVLAYSVDVTSKVCSAAEAKDKKWRSPLALAATHGHCFLIEWMIGAGATLTSEPLIAGMSYSRCPHVEILRKVRHLFKIGLAIDCAIVLARLICLTWFNDQVKQVKQVKQV